MEIIEPMQHLQVAIAWSKSFCRLLVCHDKLCLSSHWFTPGPSYILLLITVLYKHPNDHLCCILNALFHLLIISVLGQRIMINLCCLINMIFSVYAARLLKFSMSDIWNCRSFFWKNCIRVSQQSWLLPGNFLNGKSTSNLPLQSGLFPCLPSWNINDRVCLSNLHYLLFIPLLWQLAKLKVQLPLWNGDISVWTAWSSSQFFEVSTEIRVKYTHPHKLPSSP